MSRPLEQTQRLTVRVTISMGLGILRDREEALGQQELARALPCAQDIRDLVAAGDAG